MNVIWLSIAALCCVGLSYAADEPGHVAPEVVYVPESISGTPTCPEGHPNLCGWKYEITPRRILRFVYCCLEDTECCDVAPLTELPSYVCCLTKRGYRCDDKLRRCVRPITTEPSNTDGTQETTIETETPPNGGGGEVSGATEEPIPVTPGSTDVA